MTLADILLKCYECGESIGEGDLQVNGKKYGITGYFHPSCWDKYQKDHNMTVTIAVIPLILWQDQAEWYVICQDCYNSHKHHLWSGSTEVKDWSKHKRSVQEYAKTVEKCEFCNVEFGVLKRPQFPSSNVSKTTKEGKQ